MDHSDYPVLNPSHSRPRTRPTGRDGLELFSFLFALTSRCLDFFNHGRVYPQNKTALGTALYRLPFRNSPLTRPASVGKRKKLTAASGMFLGTVIFWTTVYQ